MLTYSELVALLRERNRPSGGIRTIHEVSRYCMIDKSSVVLEIGCNTGFTSANLAMLTKCTVTGIDILEDSIKEAIRYVNKQGVSEHVKFVKADVRQMPFDNESFDVIWASNVTSFIEEKKKSFDEYLRVLKNLGFLVMIPIWYYKRPPKDLIESVELAIGCSLTLQNKVDWVSLAESMSTDAGHCLQLILDRDFRYNDQESRIDSFCELQFSKQHLKHLDSNYLATVKREYKSIMKIFNKNLQYCAYSILIFQKRYQRDEMELFITRDA